MENMQIQNNTIDTAIRCGEVYFWEVLASIKTGATTAKREYLLTDFGTN
jgi:hypothetical protein